MSRLMPKALLLVVLLLPTAVLAQLRFQEGRHYSQVAVPQATGLAPAGRIEVTEVFSYICSGCNGYQEQIEQLKAKLPADAVLNYVHAGFNTNWPVFQRAHLTAQQLGIADRNHARLFNAIWRTAEFPYFDPATGRPRNPAPAIRDFARFYAKGGGVTENDFARRAAAPEMDALVERTDALIRGWQVPSTPSLVVAGRYRLNLDEVSTSADLAALTNFLIGLERSRLKKAAPAR
jgi:thiol:disulfide interchange protein DsbA